MQEIVLFYNGLGIPTRQILDSRGAIPSKTAADAKVAIQEMAEYSQKWHNGTSRSRSTETSDGLAAIQAQLNNLGREIKEVNEKVYAAQIECEQCKGPHYTKDFPLNEEGQTLEEAYYMQFGGPFQKGGYRATAPGFYQRNNMNPSTVKYPKGITENVLVGIGKFVFPVDFIILDMPEDFKVPLILERPFLSTARAKIDVYKRNITLRVGEEMIVFISVKPASSLIMRVYMLSLRERMELNLEARLMRATLVLNRPLDPFFEDYIELNDLNKPFELRRNQGDDLMPTIEEGEVIEEFRTRDDELDIGIDDYPSYYDYDKKIHIDCAHNLKFSCMIGFEFTHANFFPLLYVNLMSKKFHNSIMKDKMLYKGNNVVGALMNVPIFVGTFSVVTDFVVLENIDTYRDEGMGDVIFGEPFLREVRIKTKWFEGIITIYNGDDEVTYQMMQSYPRVKHHTKEQCNNIPPLLKLTRRYFEDDYSDKQCAVSIKEDTVFPCLHSPKTTKETSLIRRIQERQYAVFKLYGNKIFWKISNVVPTPRNSNTPYPIPWIRLFIVDILVYSRSKEEHEQRLDTILRLLKDEKLYAKFLKCEFWLREVHFLDHVINKTGIQVDPVKVEAIKNWEAPRNPTEICQFLGLTGYYRRIRLCIDAGEEGYRLRFKKTKEAREELYNT
ncbi:homeodomain-like protein [Tanacetum coccineum]